MGAGVAPTPARPIIYLFLIYVSQDAKRGKKGAQYFPGTDAPVIRQ